MPPYIRLKLTAQYAHSNQDATYGRHPVLYEGPSLGLKLLFGIVTCTYKPRKGNGMP